MIGSYSKRIHAVFFVCLSISVSACTLASKEQGEAANNKDAIEAELQHRLRMRYKNYQELTLSSVEFSSNLSTMCGAIEMPGRVRHFFVSTDIPGDNRERTASAPLLISNDSWDDPNNRQLSDLALKRCHELGLLLSIDQ